MQTIKPSDIRSFTYYRIPVGLVIAEYYLDEHNVNNIELPNKRTKPIQKICICEHQLKYNILRGGPLCDDDGKDYFCSIINGEQNVIPHYLTSLTSTWKILKDDYEPAFQQKKETGCITIGAITSTGFAVPPMYNIAALEDTARITAYYLYKLKLPKKGSILYHKVIPDGYIRTHWKDFILSVRKYYKQLGGK